MSTLEIEESNPPFSVGNIDKSSHRTVVAATAAESAVAVDATTDEPSVLQPTESQGCVSHGVRKHALYGNSCGVGPRQFLWGPIGMLLHIVASGRLDSL